MTALVWFRRDLRLHDHPALRAALDAHERVVPVFCFDDRILSGRHRSGPRTQFMIECLEDLDGSLRDRGAGLVIRHGPPERELVELAGEVGAEEIHFTRDVSPYARRRAGRVHDACAEARVELCGHPGSTVVDDVRELRTNDGKPYTVFTPFWRAALGAPHREVIGAPRKVSMPSRVRKGQVPRLEDLGLEERVADPVPGGETEARRHLSNFVRSRVERYSSSQDDLGDDGTSRLSPYLHFGCLSPREVVERAPDDGKGPGAFRR
ncbi:MAG: deoxyribodipyrimidine photo-lyase, partial [Thermoleophilaceae bacterium]|nr:deoxyribodipyrimidine photo-lyase [Thermoleophilaceae bacterium]